MYQIRYFQANHVHCVFFLRMIFLIAYSGINNYLGGPPNMIGNMLSAIPAWQLLASGPMVRSNRYNRYLLVDWTRMQVTRLECETGSSPGLCLVRGTDQRGSIWVKVMRLKGGPRWVHRFPCAFTTALSNGVISLKTDHRPPLAFPVQIWSG